MLAGAMKRTREAYVKTVGESKTELQNCIFVVVFLVGLGFLV